jgi:hypothetical protein
MEAIYEFDVVDMPVTVAVDANGTSVHTTGPAEWSKEDRHRRVQEDSCRGGVTLSGAGRAQSRS